MKLNADLSTHPTPAPATKMLMRSGTAARLAGISASTLRIWEHRYAVVSPPKSPAGQRTYSMKDVQRLRMIKKLTLEGHAIGMLAGLSVDELQQLSPPDQHAANGAFRVMVVGQVAARKLEGRLQPPPAFIFDDLDHAEADLPRDGAVDVLVVHMATLHSSVVERVLALRHGIQAAKVIVVYAFGAEPVAEALHSAGVLVRRVPITGRELASLVMAAAEPAAPQAAASTPVNPRRYSDAELASLAEMPSTVLCECPRHLAEIVTLLVGFERYSAECVSVSTADAALHRHLHEVTGTARVMFEAVLGRVVADEGLTLSP